MIVRLTGLLGLSLDPYVDDIVAVVAFIGEIDGTVSIDSDEVPEARSHPPLCPAPLTLLRITPSVGSSDSAYACFNPTRAVPHL